MLYAPFKIGFALILLAAFQSLVEIYSCTRGWMKNDIQIARLGDSWSDQLNQILRLNQTLEGIEALCLAKPDPASVSALRKWATLIQNAQSSLWKKISFEMNAESLVSTSTLNPPLKSPPGLCISGLLVFRDTVVFESEREYSGLGLYVEGSKAYWRFQHSGIRRRL